MATEVGHAYYGWSHQEMLDHDASQEASISQMLDHGSVSFGRYDVENLSWENKSIFTCNRRQEELEKFRMQGLVAQKKAYFEEYFKRIRAAKSLQDKQQSEITVNHQDDTSSSRNSGGENKLVADLECEGDQVAYVDSVGQEHGSTGISVEEATHPSEVLQASSLSPSKDFAKNQKMNCSSCAKVQAISKKNIDNQGINSIDHQKENRYNCAVQIQQLDPEFATDGAQAESKQNIDNHGKIRINSKRVSERDVKLSYNGRSPISAKRAAPYARNTKQQRPKISHAENGTMEETSQNKQTNKEEMAPLVRTVGFCMGGFNTHQVQEKNKEERVPGPKLKNPSRTEVYLDSKGKAELNRLNPVQIKAEISVCTGITTAAKLLSNKSILMHSNKSVLEGQSKITIPRPFSFATEKRASAPNILREITQTSTSKLSNRMTSSLTHEKNRSLVRRTSERATMANDGKGRILEEKRNCEKGTLLVSDNKHTSVTRKGDTMVGFSKSRTINLPRGNKSINPCSGRENRPEGVAREIRQPASHLSLNPSKMRYNNLSLDSKKPRQAKPLWR